MHTTQEVSRLIGCKLSRVYDAVRRDGFTPKRLGKSYVWTDADVEKLRRHFAEKEKCEK